MLRLLGILTLGNLIFGGNRRRNDSLLGGLLLLPALIFGGWVALAVIGGVFSLIATVIGGIFSGLASIASGIFSGHGLVIGIIIGIALYYYVRRQNNETAEEELSMLILIGILVFSAFLYRKSLRLEGAAETNQDLSVRAYVDGKRVTSYVKDHVS